MATYREDMRRAWDRINAFPRSGSRRASGPSNTPITARGIPPGVPWSPWMSRRQRRYLVGEPPRAGVSDHRPFSVWLLRLDAPAECIPADQADAYALLLDHLGVDRAVVLAYSAGSGSVLELGRRHPQRVIGLILACCRLGGGVTLGKAFAPLLRLAYSADRLFWTFKKLMPTTYSQMMGIPKGFQPSPQEAEAIAASRDLLFPLNLWGS
jgi:pimeloyl-ACP methyl ester carboxylesterase